jgi:hypothetical protein
LGQGRPRSRTVPSMEPVMICGSSACLGLGSGLGLGLGLGFGSRVWLGLRVGGGWG